MTITKAAKVLGRRLDWLERRVANADISDSYASGEGGWMRAEIAALKRALAVMNHELSTSATEELAA